MCGIVVFVPPYTPLVAKCEPQLFRLEKTLKIAKTSKRRSACVGHTDFGKLELNNIRKDSGNS